MTPPLSHTAEQLYESLAPLAWDDEAQGFALAHFCQALALALDEVADLALDVEDSEQPGFAALFDVDTIPEKFLPYVGQFVGVDVPDYLTEDAKRLRIKETAGWKRGSPGAVKGAARQYLTGTGTVYLVERHGSAYRITVTTLTSETPQPALTAAAIAAQIPAGLLFTHSVVAPGTFNILRDTHSDFDDVEVTFINFAEIVLDPDKQYDYSSLASTYVSYATMAASFTDYADLQTAA